MNSKNLRLVALGFVAGAIFITAFGLLLQQPAQADETDVAIAAQAAEGEVKRVRIASVESKNRRKNVRFSAVVRAQERAQLAFTIGGRVAARSARVGDRVERGQVLARIDAGPFRNALSATEAALAEVQTVIAQSERDVARAEKLARSNAVGSEELEKVQSGLEAARANEARLKAQADEDRRRLGEATLFAPFAGTVTDVFVESGEFAQPGVAAIGLSGIGQREIEIETPETYSDAIRLGQKVKINLPLSSSSVTEGEVVRIGGAARGRGRLFPVTIELKDLVPAGASAEVELSLELGESPRVPVEAVCNPGGERPFVFRVREQKVERVFVDVAELVGNSVAVVGALEVGDQVVRVGHASLLDGDAVEVIE